MKIKDLITMQSPLKDENSDVRKAVRRIARTLCMGHGIHPERDECIAEFGLLTDQNNEESVSFWVYQQLPKYQAESQDDLFRELSIQFAKKIDFLTFRW